MATRKTPTEARTLTRADADAHRVALRRIEADAHAQAEAECSQEPDRQGRRRRWSGIHAQWFDLDDEAFPTAYDQATADKIARILGYRPLGLLINGDPRGYALKIEFEHAADLMKDWGSYGIIAPDKSEQTR